MFLLSRKTYFRILTRIILSTPYMGGVSRANDEKADFHKVATLLFSEIYQTPPRQKYRATYNAKGSMHSVSDRNKQRKRDVEITAKVKKNKD